MSSYRPITLSSPTYFNPLTASRLGNYLVDSNGNTRFSPMPIHDVRPMTAEEKQQAAEGMRECFRECCEERRLPCYDCMFEWRPGRVICCASTVFCCCTSALVVSACANASFKTQFESAGIAAATATACWTLICGYYELRDSNCCPRCCGGYQQV